MILYVNGDSHSVGHGINHNLHYGMTFDDIKYKEIGEAPHPLVFPYSYGAKLGDLLKLDVVCQGRSGGSWDRVIRLTKQFIYQTHGKIFVLLGIPDSQREEWFYKGVYYQINSAGADYYPVEIQEKYKKWVMEKDDSVWYKRSVYIHDSATTMHHWLKTHNIPHLFFNFNQSLNMASEQLKKITDFGINFIHPYEEEYCYDKWCRSQGFNPDSLGHYDSDAHSAWADFLKPYIEKIISI